MFQSSESAVSSLVIMRKGRNAFCPEKGMSIGYVTATKRRVGKCLLHLNISH